jgi:hypothetical protein
MNPVEEHISTADFVAGGASRASVEEPVEKQEEAGQLLQKDFVDDLRHKWDQVQTGFVDEPRAAVKEADELVAQAMKRLAELFADERSRLEQQWDRGDNVNTEDLRIALKKYRSFFQRLLSV